MSSSSIEWLRAHAAAGGSHWIVEALDNPVTGTKVLLEPPCMIDLSSGAQAEDEYLDLIRRFEEYCRAAWDLGRIAPDTIRSTVGWVTSKRASTLRIVRRTPEERRTYLAAKRAELEAAGKDTTILDIVEELITDE